jgi:hypothetical protein
MNLLLRAESGPAAIIGGIVGWIVLMVIISVYRGAKKAIKGKQFEEGDKK